MELKPEMKMAMVTQYACTRLHVLAFLHSIPSLSSFAQVTICIQEE